MKISAIDIRKHTFEKIFRGYDPDEVDAFLNSLSQEWERVSSENNLLKMQLEYAEKELAKLKDIESTLFRTLKAAEDTSRMIEKEANENAEKRIEESRLAANDLVAEAENRTNRIVQETEEKLKRFKDDFAAEIRVQERDFKAIENFRENLIVQLSSLANSTMETVERFEQKFDKESVLNRMEEIRKHVSDIELPKKGIAQMPAPEPAAPVAENETEEEVLVVLNDEKPDIIFDLPEAEPEIEDTEPVAEEIPEVPVEEPVFAEPVAEFTPEPAVNVRDEKPARTAADEANEALAEMHQSAERARVTSPGINRPRTPESTPARKTTGGGSFFDQI
ncbi:DivIVA domain-containing protein [Dyadobacter sandarakinus]|uniref:DivIVA domain-containing protein n=1 Tax=Dyadobacter sandarakinus TaxID=2747268 RepID=A0ABX7ID50_9BACT|nr:DivIVA domain-containing protein [Dyadobacter sandarakinus]QRR03628.1 DivIVA domain-containing protein [Dyadobacter sandarakinus]